MAGKKNKKKPAPPKAAGGRSKKGKGGAGSTPAAVIQLIAKNRKARHLYTIQETLEAGLMMLGTEVKSCRNGDVNLTDSFVRMRHGEPFLHGAHIGAYKPAGQSNHEPLRERKMLLNRREIDRLDGKIRQQGLTLVVLSLYFKDGRLKAELGLAKGKKAHDKRATLKERAVRKEMDRAMKRRQ